MSLGRVIDQRDRSPIGDLTVEAWDAQHRVPTAVANAVTGADGGYTIVVDEARVRELFRERKPTFYFRVLRAGKLVRNTDGVIRWNEALADSVVVIEVDLQGSGVPPDRAYVVHGTVTAGGGIRYRRPRYRLLGSTSGRAFRSQADARMQTAPTA